MCQSVRNISIKNVLWILYDLNVLSLSLFFQSFWFFNFFATLPSVWPALPVLCSLQVSIFSLISVLPFHFPPTFSHNVYLALFTWVSSTNWANCQGSIKHKLEMPRATIAVRLGFRVLGREETQMGGKGDESEGVTEIRWDVLRRVRKHMYKHSLSHQW